MSDWKPGDVALCVDDRDPKGYRDWCPLRAGRTYTVVGVFEAVGATPITRNSRHLCLRLLEQRNETARHDGFAASRFKKLVTEEETFSAAPIEKEGV